MGEIGDFDIRDRLEAFWAGERPRIIPFTIYQNEWRHRSNDPAWKALFQQGLGITWHMQSFKRNINQVDQIEDQYLAEGVHMRRRVMRTALGEISATWKPVAFMDDWPVKYWLETPEDYRVLRSIIEKTEISPAYQAYLDTVRQLPDYCVPIVDLGYSPMMKIMLDYAGLENFALHLVEFPEDVMALYDALRKNFKRICEITANGPGRYVGVLESFSAEMLGPKRFEQFLLSVYNDCLPMIRDAGKIVGCHYDGKTAVVQDLISRAPIDLLESLTPPPEGDQTLVEARRNWQDKLFWVNINVSNYNLPPDQLRASITDMVSQASPDGRLLAFEVSEMCPDNWKDSLPVVLRALREISTT